MHPDGSGLSQVAAEGVFPGWSPDGKRILFAKAGPYADGVDGRDSTRLLADATVEYDDDCRDHHSLTLLEPDGSVRKRLLPK